MSCLFATDAYYFCISTSTDM